MTDYRAEVIADSVGPNGVRLTTMVVTFPRFILPELNTHRVFSRNSASTRAIPLRRQVAAVSEHMAMPLVWTRARSGMQGGALIEGTERRALDGLWIAAGRAVVRFVGVLADFGSHKQHGGRLLEPWRWHTVVITATEWDGFFAQRCHEDAQPEMRHIAEMMREARRRSLPRVLKPLQAHLPFVSEAEAEELGAGGAIKVSVARCARVSYLTHDGRRDVSKDFELFHRLVSHRPMHASPLEHVALAMPERAGDMLSDRGRCRVAADIYVTPDTDTENFWCGNFRGWLQYRKLMGE